MDTKNILEKVKTYISNTGLTYANGVVESLFAALKTRPFVVISGKSGSGKSSLVRSFAGALGANVTNGRFKQVSVCSDWKSPARFIGHVTLEGKFIPGVCTGFIQRAIAEPELPFFLCLDDINLSRPEEYLSSFLSVFETRRRSDEGTIITDCFFDSDSFGNDISASYSYGGLYIPENLYVIGTVNCDEVSYTLSNRFLDRVHVIELNLANISIEYDIDNIGISKSLKSVDTDNSFLKSEYLNMSECRMDFEHLKHMSEIVQKFNEFLKFADAGLSYRTRDSILLYLMYCRKYELMYDDKAFDMAIIQKILPRINGMDKGIKDVLVNLFGMCMKKNLNYGDNYPNTSYKMYAVIKNSGCHYIHSAQKIMLMLRRYEEDGFTSFWQ